MRNVSECLYSLYAWFLFVLLTKFSRGKLHVRPARCLTSEPLGFVVYAVNFINVFLSKYERVEIKIINTESSDKV